MVESLDFSVLPYPVPSYRVLRLCVVFDPFYRCLVVRGLSVTLDKAVNTAVKAGRKILVLPSVTQMGPSDLIYIFYASSSSCACDFISSHGTV